VELAREFADQGSETALDRHVDVFVTGFEIKLSCLKLGGNGGESIVDCGDLVVADDPDPVQRPRVSA
jgi:hypothetical protein